MSASDLPESHAHPYAMAKALVTYIDCPDRVYRAVRDEFGTSPSRSVIRELRASHLRPLPYADPAKPHDGYYPNDAADALAETNALFLARLEAERRLSTQSSASPKIRPFFSQGRACGVTGMSPDEQEAA